MTAAISDLKDATVTGFNFPAPGIFQLKLAKAEAVPVHRLLTFDLLFLGVEIVEIASHVNFYESRIVSVKMDDLQGSKTVSLAFSNGHVEVKCVELNIRAFQQSAEVIAVI